MKIRPMARPCREGGTNSVASVVASTQTTALAQAIITLAKNNSVKEGLRAARTLPKTNSAKALKYRGRGRSRCPNKGTHGAIKAKLREKTAVNYPARATETRRSEATSSTSPTMMFSAVPVTKVVKANKKTRGSMLSFL